MIPRINRNGVTSMTIMVIWQKIASVSEENWLISIPKVTWKILWKSNVTSVKDVRPTSPVHTKVVNSITGGPEICSLTYSAAKGHARQGIDGHLIPRLSRPKEYLEFEAMKISFDQNDLGDVSQNYMTSPPLLSKPHDNEALQLDLAVIPNAVNFVW